MGAKAHLLRRPRRMLVVIVEPGLADADHLVPAGQLDEAVGRLLALLAGLVRVHADGAVDARKAPADRLDAVELAELGADGDQRADAGRQRALDHRQDRKSTRSELQSLMRTSYA